MGVGMARGHHDGFASQDRTGLVLAAVPRRRCLVAAAGNAGLNLPPLLFRPPIRNVIAGDAGPTLTTTVRPIQPWPLHRVAATGRRYRAPAPSGTYQFTSALRLQPRR